MELSKRKIPWGLNLIKDLNILGWVIILILVGLKVTAGNILPVNIYLPLYSLAALSLIVSLFTSIFTLVAVYKKSEYFWRATLYGTILSWFIPTSLDTLQVYLTSPSTYIAIGVEALVLWYWFKMKPYFKLDFVFATDENTQRIDHVAKKVFQSLVLISIVGAVIYFFILLPNKVDKIDTYLSSHTDQENLEYCAGVNQSLRKHCYPLVLDSLAKQSKLTKQVCETIPGKLDQDICMLVIKECSSISDVEMQKFCHSTAELEKTKQN